MPTVVGEGRRPDVRACGFCHLPGGDGRPENATLAGLPARYIVQQMLDFKSGARKSSVEHRRPTDLMAAIGEAENTQEIAAAAAYFSALKPQSHLTVIEAATAPRTVAKGFVMTLVPEGGTEPVGDRIIEFPNDLERFERRDNHVPITAYVPLGSIAKGKAIVTGHGGKLMPACGSCHGADLAGKADVPRLAGRSPTYIMRQLYDFRSGARAGPTALPMKSVVGLMSQEDMLNAAAYLASLKPRSPSL
ncbi:N/A [soil metagenome]